MKIYYTCPGCKSELHYDVKRGIRQIELTCPDCREVTLVNVENNERFIDSYGFKRAAILGVRAILKGLLG